MEAFFLYLMKSVFCLALFYPFYMLLMSRETFHRFNRLALIGILLASLVIPVCRITTQHPMLINELYQRWESWLTGATTSVEQDTSMEIIFEEEWNAEVTTETSAIYSPTQPTFLEMSQVHWSDILFLVYLIGILFFLVRHLLSFIRLRKLIINGKKSIFPNGICLILHNNKELAAFSWMKYIVISEDDYKENGQQILAHESAHINNRHSWDLLLVEGCVIAQWMNPIAWLLKIELQNIHEYEADETVIKQGIDAKQYQLLIIKKAVGARLYSLANSLNHSSLKKRITMMMKKKSNPWARLKYLYVLPLAALSLAAFAYSGSSKPGTEILNGKINDLSASSKTEDVKSIETTHSEKLLDFKCKIVHAQTGKPLHGANVIIEGTGNGTVSDTDGNIRLEVEEGKTIRISYIGMKTLKIIASEKNKGKTFELDEEIAEMAEEITVKGFSNADIKSAPTDNNASNQTANKKQDKSSKERYAVHVDGLGNYSFGPQNGTIKKGSLDEMANDFQTFRDKLQANGNGDNLTVQIVAEKNTPQESIDKLKERLRTLYALQINYRVEGDEVFMVVEQMPEYPGGMEALMKFIAQNIRYPKEAQEKGIQGRVIVQVTIDETGKINKPTIVKSISPEIDAEAIRIVKAMPNWIPGKQRGKAVSVKFTLPLNFSLSTGEKKEQKRTIQKQDENGVYLVPDKMPEFPGGNGALMKYLAENIRYPEKAQKEGIQGRVIVQFVVDKTGKIINPKAIRNVSPELDAEAVRVVSTMPTWKPGGEKGENVDVRFTLPIQFRLNNPQKKASASSNEEVFMIVEQMPEYPGGMEALNKFISNQLEYPKVAHENGISGRVIVQTIITKEGKITEPKVVKSVSPELDAEALRVVKLMPNWNPGKQRGIAVNVKYNIPFTFKLQ